MPAETNGNEDAMNKAGLLFLVAALLVGCTPQGPAATQTAIPATVITAPPIATPSPPATPTTMPIPATVATATAVATIIPEVTGPEVTAIPIDQSDIRCTTAEDTGDIPQEIGEVIDQLGFALQPSVLPDGFQLAGVSSNNNEIRQIYQSASNNIIIAYPLEFSPDATSGPLGWERPEDAVNSLKIGDQTVYLMKGGWSDPSIIAGPALSPDKAEWDYEKSLALFFTCRTDNGRNVDMAIQALPGPIDWIDAVQIVEIAQSLKRISRSQ